MLVTFPVVSQDSTKTLSSKHVKIDTVNNTAFLDHKGVIAVGNQLKQRDTLYAINKDKTILIDSLRGQNQMHKAEVRALREIVLPSLKQQIKEKELQFFETDKLNTINTVQLTNDLKKQRRKKWNWAFVGVLIGATIGVLSSN